MATLGLDYAGGRPGGGAIAAAGYKFVVRYLTDGGPGLPGKLLTIAEYRDLQSNGISCVTNWETTSDRMKSGRAAGIADAQAADTAARGVQHPGDRPVYFSADWDATPADQAAIDDYLRGAGSVIGQSRVGIYSGYWPVKRALDNGTAAWAWQTAAWSGGHVDPRIHIYQRIGYVTVGGVQCDVNEALRSDYGQHPNGDNMTPEEHQLLQDCRDELYRRIPTRAGDGPNPTYTDTILGYACNGDGFGWRNEQRLIAMQATIGTLTQAVATQHGLSLDDIKTMFDAELGTIVKMDISVNQPVPKQ